MDGTSKVPRKELLHVHKVSDCARFFPCKPVRHGTGCLLTGIGLTSIREAAASGALTARKHGTRTIILPKDVKSWLKTLPVIGKKMVMEGQP